MLLWGSVFLLRFSMPDWQGGSFMQITSSGGSWVWARRLGVAGTIQLVCGLVALGGFLLPWFAVDLPTYSFHVSGWETALHIGKGALWTALLGALALLGIAALRKVQ